MDAKDAPSDADDSQRIALESIIPGVIVVTLLRGEFIWHRFTARARVAGVRATFLLARISRSPSGEGHVAESRRTYAREMPSKQSAIGR